MKIKIFDEHHEAFLYWEKAALQKKIKKGATLLHVDFHDDLGVPYLTESLYTNSLRRFTQDQLNIGNFIIPSILRGTIKKVLFLSPFRNSRARNIKVGSLRGEGIYIIQKSKLNRHDQEFLPDAKLYCRTIINNISKIKEQDAILDIDLDYFSCNLYPNSQFRLKLPEQQARYLKHFSTSDDDYKLNLNFFNFMDDTINLSDINKTKNLIYNDSIEWIDYSIKSFVKELKVRPLLISICRSAKSGFTPNKYASFIEKTFIKYFNNPPDKIDFPKISNFEIFPFVGSAGNLIYNAYTKQSYEIKESRLFFWKEIKKGKNFDQILKNALSNYEVDENTAKKHFLEFILFLKKEIIIK